MWYWQKDNHIYRPGGIQSPEINPHIYSQLISSKVRLQRQCNGKMAVFSTNGAGKTGYPKANNKAESFPFTMHKTQNGSNTYI